MAFRREDMFGLFVFVDGDSLSPLQAMLASAFAFLHDSNHAGPISLWVKRAGPITLGLNFYVTLIFFI